MTGGSWVRRLGPALPGVPRLVCFPHAGGSASAFTSLSRALAPRVELLGVQYPGRQDRRHEQPVTRIHELASQAAAEIPTDAPYALLGHSMGAAVAYETALVLTTARGPEDAPGHLFLSAANPPGHGRTDDPLSDERILSEVLRLGGVRQQVLDDAELRAMVLPALRTDYHALSAYARTHVARRVGIPMTVLMGDADPIVSAGSARSWLELASAGGEFHSFPGGHFFHESHLPRIAELVADAFGPRSRKVEH